MTTLALGLVTLLAGPPAAGRPVPGDPARPPAAVIAATADHWFGADKFQHFTASFAATQFAAAGARTLGLAGAAAPAAAVSLAGGLAKELADARGGGHFCVRDLIWDVAGVLAGYALARNVR